MLSEYCKECPQCGYLRALYFRESNSKEIHIECRKCGFNQTHILPSLDETAMRRLFRLAQRRLSTSAQVSDAVGENVASGGSSNTSKGNCEHCRHYLPIIHQQLAYILRLLQYRTLMDSGADEILANEPEDYDITQDYWMTAGTFDEDAVKRLNNQYGGFENWLMASLRSLGLADDKVWEQIVDYRNDVVREEAEHIKSGGAPFLYHSVHQKDEPATS